MGGLLQSANGTLSSAIVGAGGYFDWFTSSLRQDPMVTAIVATLIVGFWLFHRSDLSAP